MTEQKEKIPANFAAARAQMRQSLIAARQALPEAERGAIGERINELLWKDLSVRRAGSLGFCWPIRGEVDCRPVVLRLLAAGWRVCMPVVTEIEAPMRFRAWWPAAPMTQDPFGIPVPDTEEVPLPEILLLPLVAFDGAGFRLGYGGGYFDRTLAATSTRPLTLGVGYDNCRVATTHPAAHDVPLDGVVTEAGTQRFAP